MDMERKQRRRSLKDWDQCQQKSQRKGGKNNAKK